MASLLSNITNTTTPAASTPPSNTTTITTESDTTAIIVNTTITASTKTATTTTASPGDSDDSWPWCFKRKALCTVRNALIACGLVLVFCLSLQLPAAASTRIVKQRKGRMVCSVLGNSVFVWSTIQAVLNMLLPCCLLMYFNTHTLIAIRGVG
ncbi:hypothetical protein ACOMHN_039821 [Nucella lapillus]